MHAPTALDLLSELILPFFAILVPTLIAIFLARSERRAAAIDRGEDVRRREQERVERGLDDALAACNELVSAGYTDDFRLAAQIRIRAAAKLSSVRLNLGESNTPAWDWIAEELGIMAQGLEMKDQYGIPTLLEQIVWRSAHFSNAIMEWRLERIDLEWFATHEHQPLDQTKIPEGDEDDPLP